MHSDLESLWRRSNEKKVEDIEAEITDFLARQSIGLRRDDGNLTQINLSIPEIRTDDLVIGIRYKKRDESDTEDHFLCTTNEGDGELIITPYYGKSLQYTLVEYAGAHKYQLTKEDYDRGPVFTQVNTISFLLNRCWP